MGQFGLDASSFDDFSSQRYKLISRLIDLTGVARIYKAAQRTKGHPILLRCWRQTVKIFDATELVACRWH